jgi:hypothetical protein
LDVELGLSLVVLVHVLPEGQGVMHMTGMAMGSKLELITSVLLSRLLKGQYHEMDIF